MEKIINDFNSNPKKINYKGILESIIKKIKILLGQRKRLTDKIQIKTVEDEQILHNIKLILVFLNYFQKLGVNKKKKKGERTKN